jgi:heme-degrading monooxygenase HmoA
MFARVTLFEIDTLRISLDTAQEQFERSIVPAARQRKGYRGMYVMRTPEGKGLIMSLWDSREAAQAGVESGYYDEQVAKFVTVYRTPPGREHYEVVLADIPGATGQ